MRALQAAREVQGESRNRLLSGGDVTPSASLTEGVSNQNTNTYAFWGQLIGKLKLPTGSFLAQLDRALGFGEIDRHPWLTPYLIVEGPQVNEVNNCTLPDNRNLSPSNMVCFRMK